MDDRPRHEYVSAANASEYEPPKVEEVLNADDLAREVHYAGVLTVSEPLG